MHTQRNSYLKIYSYCKIKKVKYSDGIGEEAGTSLQAVPIRSFLLAQPPKGNGKGECDRLRIDSVSFARHRCRRRGEPWLVGRRGIKVK